MALAFLTPHTNPTQGFQIFMVNMYSIIVQILELYSHPEQKQMEVPFRILITKLLLLTTIVGFSSFNNVIKYNQNVIDSSKTLKVLMIGNSFTFYWNLPQVIECMLNAQNTSFEVDQKTIGGSNLGKHWGLNSEKDYIRDYRDFSKI